MLRQRACSTLFGRRRLWRISNSSACAKRSHADHTPLGLSTWNSFALTDASTMNRSRATIPATGEPLHMQHRRVASGFLCFWRFCAAEWKRGAGP